MNRQIVRYVDLFSKNPMKLKTYNYLSLQFLFNFVVITHDSCLTLGSPMVETMGFLCIWI